MPLFSQYCAYLSFLYYVSMAHERSQRYKRHKQIIILINFLIFLRFNACDTRKKNMILNNNRYYFRKRNLPIIWHPKFKKKIIIYLFSSGRELQVIITNIKGIKSNYVPEETEIVYLLFGKKNSNRYTSHVLEKRVMPKIYNCARV